MSGENLRGLWGIPHVLRVWGSVFGNGNSSRTGEVRELCEKADAKMLCKRYSTKVSSCLSFARF